MTPRGSNEMTNIARVCADPELDYTIFRVPFLTNGGDAEVHSGMIGPEFGRWTNTLSRASLARWVWEEIGKRDWVRKEPALGNN